VLAKAVESEKPDLVLTGLQSDDFGYGQTGVVLAELLGWVHSTIIMHVDVNGDRIKVRRELENGWFQNIEMPLPAVLTIQSGISKLRYATLMGIKKAKSKEVKQIGLGDFGATAAPVVTISKVYLPQKAKQTQMLEGSANEVAKKLVEKLRFEVRAL
jgi:electron transfer flavoprotein beta subunit